MTRKRSLRPVNFTLIYDLISLLPQAIEFRVKSDEGPPEDILGSPLGLWKSPYSYEKIMAE